MLDSFKISIEFWVNFEQTPKTFDEFSKFCEISEKFQENIPETLKKSKRIL